MNKTEKFILAVIGALVILGFLMIQGIINYQTNTKNTPVKQQVTKPTPYPAIDQACYDEARIKAEQTMDVVNPSYKKITKERLISQGFTEEEALDLAIDATMVKARYFEKYYNECLAN